MERVYSFLLSAIGQMFAGVDPKETLALAALACHVRDGDPHAPIYEAILALLDARESYDPTGDGRPSRFAPGLHFIVVAAALARTPDVPVPDEGLSFSPRAPGSDPEEGRPELASGLGGTSAGDGRPPIYPALAAQPAAGASSTISSRSSRRVIANTR